MSAIILYLKDYRRLFKSSAKQEPKQVPAKKSMSQDERTALYLIGAFVLGLLASGR
jgi:hypothetical protein